MLTPVIALGGLLIGSFLNVVAHRLPRGESLAHPPSRCPGCGAGVRPYDNVPVLSWLLLRGACRDCRAPISARYPLVEAATALLFALVALVHGLSPQTALGLVLVALLVPITLIDLDERIIPNRLTGPGALAAIGLLAALEPGALPEHLAAGAGAALFFGLAAVARPGGMGMGDVKLAGMLGLFLGASVAFGPARRARRRDRRRRGHHGPRRRRRRPQDRGPVRAVPRPRRGRRAARRRARARRVPVDLLAGPAARARRRRRAQAAAERADDRG
jgi:leader peptidase (prepilin peptidase)/N-methyltransferase